MFVCVCVCVYTCVCVCVCKKKGLNVVVPSTMNHHWCVPSLSIKLLMYWIVMNCCLKRKTTDQAHIEWMLGPILSNFYLTMTTIFIVLNSERNNNKLENGWMRLRMVLAFECSAKKRVNYSRMLFLLFEMWQESSTQLRHRRYFDAVLTLSVLS